MNGANSLPEKRVLWGAGAFLLAMMVIGSIWDFPISKAVYDPCNPFGLFFAGFGEYPAALWFAAGGAMLLCLLPQLSPKLAGKQTALFLIGLVWTSLVAASRIVMGAHYLTDTIVGFAVGLIMLAGLCHILFPTHSRMPKVKS